MDLLGISKSYVKDVGWIPAGQLTPEQRKAVTQKIEYTTGEMNQHLNRAMRDWKKRLQGETKPKRQLRRIKEPSAQFMAGVRAMDKKGRVGTGAHPMLGSAAGPHAWVDEAGRARVTDVRLGNVKRSVDIGNAASGTRITPYEVGAHEGAHAVGGGKSKFMRRNMPGNELAMRRTIRIIGSDAADPKLREMLGSERMARYGTAEEARADVMASRRIRRTVRSGHTQEPGYWDIRNKIEERVGRPKTSRYGMAGATPPTGKVMRRRLLAAFR